MKVILQEDKGTIHSKALAIRRFVLSSLFLSWQGSGTDLPLIVAAALVGSTIAKGRITDIDVRIAEQAPGVFAVMNEIQRLTVNVTHYSAAKWCNRN